MAAILRRLEERQVGDRRKDALMQTPQAETAALSERLPQIEWIKEKSGKMIVKQQKKFGAAIPADTEREEACEQLQIVLAQCEARTADTDENGRRMAASYQQ
jgi:hypothetical protein